MDLAPHEESLIELLRAMGAEPLHLAFTCTGNGVAFSLMTEETGSVAGWGATVEAAMTNAYGVPDPAPEPEAAPAPRFAIVAGTDRRE